MTAGAVRCRVAGGRGLPCVRYLLFTVTAFSTGTAFTLALTTVPHTPVALVPEAPPVREGVTAGRIRLVLVAIAIFITRHKNPHF